MRFTNSTSALYWRKANEGKYVAIDIETGDYEMDTDELAASDRLVARLPGAQIWLNK